jgi:hypothetical protein
MASELNDKRIASLVTQEGVEKAELTKPWEAVEQAELIAYEDGEVQVFNHLDKESKFSVNRTLADAQAGPSPRGRPFSLTFATPVAIGSMRRSSLTRGSSRVASPVTCPPSGQSSSRISPRALTRPQTLAPPAVDARSV